ncbi:hypothetical protein B0H67DRAFT_640276 [Lasiosphaeris hirsuta]|uniref:Uncharacterized protein n=1 Tax=Lasiosphaeris hirsuta TaxID=260670 RepID=A0AA40BCX0_9PEZI|nr:hypothetical protein B0H67DRAFT_640276 [Lasiosphaeris hirsuta]
MAWSLPTIRTSVLCGLLAAPLFDIASATLTPALQHRAPQAQVTSSQQQTQPTITAVSNCHLHGTTQFCEAGTAEFRISGTASALSYTDCHIEDSQTHCMAPTGEVQIILAVETPAPTPSASAPASPTAVSECHLHESSIHCMVGTTEYVVLTPVTATADIPPAYTGCHAHEAETICVTPGGEEVPIALAAEEDDDHETESSSSGQNCHFHAGVEHCTTSEANVSCGVVERDYNIKLRVGLMFVILVTSSIGVFTPILVASFVSPRNIIFTILRQFGTGIIISTAFIHLFTHASLMFANDCLGELAYESTASAILMAGLFLSFLVEYAGIRLVQWHSAKSAASTVESPGSARRSASHSAEMVNITVLEAGVIFHSILIGLTLVVSADSFFLTLFAVITFHQMFEGIALGTRIAALGQPGAPPALGHGHSHGHGHGHFHGPSPTHEPSPQTLAEELVAASAAVPARPRKSLAGEHRSGSESDSSVAPAEATCAGHSVSLHKKLLLAAAFALVTPVGMAIGIGVLKHFNGNDPSTIIAIGTLDALSAGILVWVGVVEMWAHDWMLGGEMTTAGPARTALGLVSLVAGLALMSLLGKWA